MEWFLGSSFQKSASLIPQPSSRQRLLFENLTFLRDFAMKLKTPLVLSLAGAILLFSAAEVEGRRRKAKTPKKAVETVAEQMKRDGKG